jgi:hypothetical protein
MQTEYLEIEQINEKMLTPLAVETTLIEDFITWSLERGFGPNTINYVQVTKCVRYYIAYLYGIPPESSEALEHCRKLKLLK